MKGAAGYLVAASLLAVVGAGCLGAWWLEGRIGMLPNYRSAVDVDEGDEIDLSAIDAGLTAAGNQAFDSFSQGAVFSGTFARAGALFFEQSTHTLYGNVDADGCSAHPPGFERTEIAGSLRSRWWSATRGRARLAGRVDRRDGAEPERAA